MNAQTSRESMTAAFISNLIIQNPPYEYQNTSKIRIDYLNQLLIMIHGHKKEKIQKTQEQIKQEEDLSNKINSKLSDFFVIRSKPFTNQQIPKYLQFTALLMQLCSDISTIFNFRREIILKYLQSNEQSQAEILAADIKLTTKLIKDDPKSYTLWSYRQWLIQKLYKINPKIVDQEKMLCKMLLMKDQKNFHVWNYRNWVNSVQFRVDQELAFTQQKIKANPFNFSPYHFRSKYLPQKYINLLNNEKLEQSIKKQILSYGMPKQIFDEQLQKVKTAMFLNPNQEAPWNYYRWLIRRTLPIIILEQTQAQNQTKVIVNQNITKQELQRFITNEDAILTCPHNAQSSHTWAIISLLKPLTIKYSQNISEKVDSKSLMQCQSVKKRFMIRSSATQGQLSQLQSFYEAQIQFIKQILSEEQNCRFALFQKLQLIKLVIHLKANSNKHLLEDAIAVCERLLSAEEVKTKQYIEQLLAYWKTASKAERWTDILQ